MSGSGTAKLVQAATGTGRHGAEPQGVPIVIGKDVLELVSSAMYVDPMAIYREYIQNAADAADAARAAGLLAPDEPGRVEITTDPVTRTVKIRDNGCGIPSRDFGRRLLALGGSAKRGTPARGFRGVGRLAGLAYAQELVFRSRACGETRISELRWDCRQLKAALRDPGAKAGVADLIRNVTTLARFEDAHAPERFFEVELRALVRLRNDRLMSPSAISEYLSQTAPVPFSPEFRLGPVITEALSRHLDLGALDIRIDGGEQPVYKPHRDYFASDKASISFDDLSLLEIPGIEGNLAAVAWVLHHEYEGAVPSETLVKGLRLRTGNVQVGDHNLLENLFPEPRFNAWSVGEVHVLDRRIAPNGRRDHFEQNAHLHNVLNHLTPIARDIARRCRTSSIRRKWRRDFELQAHSVEETISIIEQGGLSPTKRDRLALLVEQTLVQMSRVAAKDLLGDEANMHGPLLENLRSRLNHAMNDSAPVASPLMRLPADQRDLYQRFFELVFECSPNRIAAKSLIDRILIRLAQ